MIAHVSPADRQRDESRNTLVYADRAKNISNKVIPKVFFGVHSFYRCSLYSLYIKQSWNRITLQNASQTIYWKYLTLQVYEMGGSSIYIPFYGICAWIHSSSIGHIY